MDDATPNLEEAFLAALEHSDFDPQSLMDQLEEMRTELPVSSVDSCAELLQEALLSRGFKDEAREVLCGRMGRRLRESKLGRHLESEMLAVIGNGRRQRCLIRHVGFGENVPWKECFRRLDLLLSLKEDALCFDETWGAGRVKQLDLLYDKVMIDFEGRPNHELDLGYAAKSLTIPKVDHLQYKIHHEREQLDELIKKQPGEVVCIAIRSYGPMTAPVLQELLVPEPIPEKNWKRFWDAARKALKNDPMVDMPTKRSQPITLRKKALVYDVAWFEALADELDMRVLLERFAEAAQREDACAVAPQAWATIADRLHFIVTGAGRRHPEFIANCLMLADRFGVPADLFDPTPMRDAFLQPDEFNRLMSRLTVREVKAFLDYLGRTVPEQITELLISQIPIFDAGVLGETMELLDKLGCRDAGAAVFREHAGGMNLGVDMLLWITRHPEVIQEWKLGSRSNLNHQLMNCIELDYNGEKLKSCNQLKERFAHESWLNVLLEEMDDSRRRELLKRLRGSTAWNALDRQSIMGRLVKRYPELEQVLAERRSVRMASRGPVTSQRTYIERQKQLEHINQVDLPRIGKEIGVARSYGDLRENYEYKAAKEMQGLLMRRKAEIQSQLKQVKPTLFNDIPTNKVAPGVTVQLRYTAEEVERYVLLGAWDRDEDLSIISSESALAKALMGAEAGENRTVPGEHGDRMVRVELVETLSPAVREWIEADPGEVKVDL